jgi:hypothetical protein
MTNEFQRMQKLAGLITESEYHKSSVNEISTGGLDTKVLYNFINKHGDSFAGTDTSELESVKGKEIFLDDLLTTQDGLNMLSGKLPKFAEALKKYNIKLNLNKANIEHPNDVAKIYDALIKPGIITLDDLKNVPNIVAAADAKSANWTDEVINKLKDQKHINAAQILKGTALNENVIEEAKGDSKLNAIADLYAYRGIESKYDDEAIERYGKNTVRMAEELAPRIFAFMEEMKEVKNKIENSSEGKMLKLIVKNQLEYDGARRGGTMLDIFNLIDSY